MSSDRATKRLTSRAARGTIKLTKARFASSGCWVFDILWLFRQESYD
ncbi:MAG: hypothetical protein AVDCRST_MAG93-4750 [uncultured Chloroflexia bacterium]|uniref:Uncharacterized protein n=1 Tax=uncultured Chloroflexia bacterium TaxID=1672391 RepID=A0A6J4KDZ0_9CHLR|nr:MAG: hypothetical protein AVDCRST_MAG93-4750 [uncultured Chloroflexia bacterium]